MKNQKPHSFFQRNIRLATGVLGISLAGFAANPAIAADETSTTDHSHHQHSEHAGHDMSSHTGHDMSDHSDHGAGAYMDIGHRHGKGAWMFEYRFMRMNMEGLLDGTDEVSTDEVSGMAMGGGLAPGKSYMMAPTKMTMDMHMLMAMYGITDKLMVMGMANYLRNDMEMVMHMFTNTGVNLNMDSYSDMESSGVGDTIFGAMYRVMPSIQLGLNLSLPTGSIDEKDDMDMGAGPTEVTLPYPMQLGSGTYDLIPSIQYKGNTKSFGWGAQASYTFRSGKNDRDYKLGDRLDINGWAKYAFNQHFLISGRLAFADWGKVEDDSPEMVSMSPNYDPNATGGTRTDLHLGMAAFFGKTHSLGLEYGVPIYQDLNGPQMKMESIIGLRYYYMIM